VCCFSLFPSLSLPSPLSLSRLPLPFVLLDIHPRFQSENRAELSISWLPLTFHDLVRVIGMPEARRRALVTDIGGNDATYMWWMYDPFVIRRSYVSWIKMFRLKRTQIPQFFAWHFSNSDIIQFPEMASISYTVICYNQNKISALS